MKAGDFNIRPAEDRLIITLGGLEAEVNKEASVPEFVKTLKGLCDEYEEQSDRESLQCAEESVEEVDD